MRCPIETGEGRAVCWTAPQAACGAGWSTFATARRALNSLRAQAIGRRALDLWGAPRGFGRFRPPPVPTHRARGRVVGIPRCVPCARLFACAGGSRLPRRPGLMLAAGLWIERPGDAPPRRRGRPRSKRCLPNRRNTRCEDMEIDAGVQPPAPRGHGRTQNVTACCACHPTRRAVARVRSGRMGRRPEELRRGAGRAGRPALPRNGGPAEGQEHRRARGRRWAAAHQSGKSGRPASIGPPPKSVTAPSKSFLPNSRNSCARNSRASMPCRKPQQEIVIRRAERMPRLSPEQREADPAADGRVAGNFPRSAAAPSASRSGAFSRCPTSSALETVEQRRV